MNMQELGNDMYIKSTDSVERYLLELVRAYLNDNPTAEGFSRESFIRSAVAQMKQELDFSGIGVQSVNGQTGVIEITAEQLGAEPAILNKRSAFNVDFGTTKGTACEGNDPRLSDPRTPKPHQHSVDDINGLENQLNALKDLDKSLKNIQHQHDNLETLNRLIYTGNRSQIDLKALETIEPEIEAKITQIESRIQIAKNELNQIMAEIDKKINEFDLTALKAYITTTVDGKKQDAITDAQKAVDSLRKELDEEFAGLISKDEMRPLYEAMSGSEYMIASMTAGMDSMGVNGAMFIRATDAALNALREQGIDSLLKCRVACSISRDNILKPLPAVEIDSAGYAMSFTYEVAPQGVTLIREIRDGYTPSDIYMTGLVNIQFFGTKTLNV